MDKTVDQGPAAECTAAHPCLTNPPKKKKILVSFFFRIGASVSIGQEIWCLPYAGFLK